MKVWSCSVVSGGWSGVIGPLILAMSERYRTTTLSFVKADGCLCSKLTPEDGQRTPETYRVAKIKPKQSDIKLVAYIYCNTMHGTVNLKDYTEIEQRGLELRWLLWTR
jgi:hypothetical protein